MTGKLDEYLRRKLQTIAQQPSDESVAVIATLRSRSKTDELADHGLAIAHVFESIPAVSGEIRLSRLAELAALDQVEKVEFDSEMHALKE